jgi:uncharacterized membrane protein YedE/YeeE
MRTRAADRHGVGESARLVAERASAIVRLELRLAAAELKRKAAALAVGIGLGVAAVVLVLLGIGFAVAAGAAALALVLPTWAALLVVTGGLLGLAAVLAVTAAALFRRATPPVPTQAIEEAKLTAEALRSNGHH